ncbi:MAG TPA: TRC40/GET3/ArsA family transport-energizing ATPase [Acidimicrobiales bacterium]
MRILLFTGKGGVGKTTVAAATAAACAARGERTLVFSTDPAHSLADSLDQPVGASPTEVGHHLSAQQLDARERTEEAWDDIQEYLVEVFDWAGVEGIEAEELAVLPGLDELFGLVDLKSHAGSGDWDTIVVDCAPTAETIRLLSLPDVLSWYMTRIFPMTRRMNKVVGPVVSRMTRLPVAGDRVFGAADRFYARLDGVKEILGDPDLCSARLVVNPEKMVIAEARRTYTYLSLFGYTVDAVIVNRVLPPAVSDPWFDRWKAVQAEHLEAIDEAFAPLPILRAHLAETEVVGLAALSRLAEELYGERPPAARLQVGQPLRFERFEGRRAIVLDLPFAERGQVDVGRRGSDLLITLGPYRRVMTLPDSLVDRPVREAKLRDGTLTVVFGDLDE